MSNKHGVLFLKLTSGFFLNTAAAWYFAVFLSPSLLEKLNDVVACCACFGAAYFLELFSHE